MPVRAGAAQLSLLMAAALTLVPVLDGSSTSWAIVVGEQGNVLKSLDNGGVIHKIGTHCHV